MNYYLQHYYMGRSDTVKLDAKSLDVAQKEAVVHFICKHWSFDFPCIDYSNFEESLLKWLKETNYWDMESIADNVHDNLEYHDSFEECLMEQLSLMECNPTAEILPCEDTHTLEDTIYQTRKFVAKEVGMEVKKILSKTLKKQLDMIEVE